jgi:hypothetical protein
VAGVDGVFNLGAHQAAGAKDHPPRACRARHHKRG